MNALARSSPACFPTATSFRSTRSKSSKAAAASTASPNRNRHSVGRARQGMTTATAEPANTVKIFGYFTPLTFLVYLVMPHGYLLDFATSYMLKDQLHASVTQVSTFRLLTAIPVYLSVVFGLTRDLWNPLGMRDRGYFLIFAPLTAGVFAWMAYSKLTYNGLFIGMFLVMFRWRFVAAGQWALLALVGQEKLMSGRLSALWNIISSIPYVAGALASGWIAEHLPPHQTFILMAGLSLLGV